MPDLVELAEEETVFSFEELSENAKERARRDYRDQPYYLEDEWYEAVYEDAKQCAIELGIEIGNIYFSGFCSQGDGACFTGQYTYAPDALKNIKQHAPQDETLHTLAEQLTVLQITAKLEYGVTFEAFCHHAGRGNHSGCMHVETHPSNDDVEIDSYFADVHVPLRAALRSFADWIYKQLEAEYDYLHTDEVIDGYLADLSFDEDGEEI